MARPVIILVYTTLNTICNIDASRYITNSIRKDKIKERKKKKQQLQGDNRKIEDDFIKLNRKKQLSINEEIKFEHPDIP